MLDKNKQYDEIKKFVDSFESVNELKNWAINGEIEKRSMSIKWDGEMMYDYIQSLILEVRLGESKTCSEAMKEFNYKFNERYSKV